MNILENITESNKFLELYSEDTQERDALKMLQFKVIEKAFRKKFDLLKVRKS